MTYIMKTTHLLTFVLLTAFLCMATTCDFCKLFEVPLRNAPGNTGRQKYLWVLCSVPIALFCKIFYLLKKKY